MESIFTCYADGCLVTHIVIGHNAAHLEPLLDHALECPVCHEQLAYVDHKSRGWLDTRHRIVTRPAQSLPPPRPWKKQDVQMALDILGGEVVLIKRGKRVQTGQHETSYVKRPPGE